MFQIRVAKPSDAQAIQQIYAPYVLSTPITFEIEVPAVDQFRESIEQRLRTYPWLVAESESGQVVGYAYACEHATRAAYRWSAQVSIYLAPTHHRQGIGAVFYKKLLSILQRQGFRMVYAGITLPNVPSVGVHEAMGFVHVATWHNAGFKLDQWRDVGWWELDLNPNSSSAPNQLIPFSELESLPELD